MKADLRRLGSAAGIGGTALLIAAAAPAARTTTAAPTCHGLAATIVGTENGEELDGTRGNDVIVALGGNDVVFADAGDDVVCAGNGDDTLEGDAGNDVLSGQAGSDIFIEGDGNDRLEGGTTTPGTAADIVAYGLSTRPVQVNLGSGHATGDGEDTLSGIDVVDGSRYNDTLVGNARPNWLYGDMGTDSIDGAGGDDVAGFFHPVTANLGDGSARGEGADAMVNVEGLAGSAFADVLIGSGGANYLDGSEGNDKVEGGGGDDRLFGDAGNDAVQGGDGDDLLEGGAGDDTLDGGAGAGDAVTYAFSSTRVSLDLSTGIGIGEGRDSVAGTEGAFGSEWNDTIVGDDGPNILQGGAGNDQMSGGGGADFVGGGGGRNTVSGGAGADYCLDGTGASACEVSGDPGALPGKAAGPPHASSASFAIGEPERAPTPAQRILSSLRRARLRAFADANSAARAATDRMNRAVLPMPAVRLFSPLRGLEAAVSRLTDRFDLRGQPVCLPRSRPFVTSITPPVRVDPVGNGNRTEHASWQAYLVKWNIREKTWLRVRSTPWATAQISGGNVPPGIPNWVDASGRSVDRIAYSVGPGRYAWGAQLRWDRTPQAFYGFVEPHIVDPAKTPRKYCQFG